MWIAAAIKKPGSLHKELGVAEGKKIPKAKLEKAAKHKGIEGKRARLAETLEGLHHGKKHDKKHSSRKLEEKVYKQIKSGEKADEKVHKDIAKVLKHEKKEAAAGKKGDKKLHEMAEKRHEKKEHHSKEMPKAKAKMKKVMTEFSKKELHSGSKQGPLVTNPKQAVAIAYSESKKAKKK